MKAQEYLDDLLELQEYHKGLGKLSHETDYLIAELMTSVIGLCKHLKQHEESNEIK